MLSRIAPTDYTVLIEGESGTGKELIARAVHAASEHHDGPFVPVNCAAIPDTLIESELFGHSRGAFSGATRDREGRFSAADGGTLFLDEIGEMSPAAQAKLLRVLEARKLTPVGSEREQSINCRVIAATHRDLPAMVAAGQFREDLYHRLGVVPVQVPALAERREDIPELIEHFARSYSLAAGQPLRHLASDAVAVLQTRDWTGNVRELKNNVERILIVAGGDPASDITAAALPSDTAGGNSAASAIGGEQLLALPLREAREAFERDYIAAQLSRFGGNISRTSGFIGMERSALHRKIKLLGLASRNEEAV
jgi:two-component system nitrogen regulation response regulator NtrX